MLTWQSSELSGAIRVVGNHWNGPLRRERTDSLRHLWTPNSTAEAMHSASPQVGSPPLLVSIPTPMSATTVTDIATE